MKILILGGSGFIGRNLSKILSLKNEIIIVDSNIDYEFFEDIKISKENLYQINLENIKNHSDIFSSVDVVFYLVNFTTPFLNLEGIKEAYSKDISMCIDILELSRENNIRKVFFSSSGGAIYGNTNNDKYQEDDVTNPINYYGISKLSLEKIVLMYNKLYGMDNLILRISNPYGKYQISNKVGIISIFLRKILNNEIVEVFGDGTNIRDYIYIDDLMEIFEKIIMKRKYDYSVYNIGSGEGKSILDILEEIKKITKKDFNIKFNENRNFDVKRNVLDISRIQKEFDFVPKINLEEGIKLLYSHLKNK